MSKYQQIGFTLIEILIALSVFALLASITSSVLYNAFNTKARVNEQANALNTLQLALLLIQRDSIQVVARSVRENDMKLSPIFVGKANYLEFTRSGIANPGALEQRSTLQRIAYLCSNNRLIRRYWDVLDITNRKRFNDRVLLDNLSDCHFAYLDRHLQVMPTWQEVQDEEKKSNLPLPKAIQLNLRTHWGDLSLLLVIPEALLS